MLAEPKQYCEHSTFGTEQHRPVAAAPLLMLQGLEASPLQSEGGTGGRHCWPTEQLQTVAAWPRGGEGQAVSIADSLQHFCSTSLCEYSASEKLTSAGRNKALWGWQGGQAGAAAAAAAALPVCGRRRRRRR